MKINLIPVGPIGANCIFLSNNDNETVIIDAGGEPEKIARHISINNLKPIQIMCTHGHWDHVGAIPYITRQFDIPAFIHEQDNSMLENAIPRAAYFGVTLTEAPKATDFFSDGDNFVFGDIEINVLHTPGHSAGGVSFYLPKMGIVITGDTLFADAIGRTDLYGGSLSAITNSIKTKLYTLPDDTKVYPGHGASTSIGHEKQHNMYVRGENY